MSVDDTYNVIEVVYEAPDRVCVGCEIRESVS